MIKFSFFAKFLSFINYILYIYYIYINEYMRRGEYTITPLHHYTNRHAPSVVSMFGSLHGYSSQSGAPSASLYNLSLRSHCSLQSGAPSAVLYNLALRSHCSLQSGAPSAALYNLALRSHCSLQSGAPSASLYTVLRSNPCHGCFHGRIGKRRNDVIAPKNEPYKYANEPRGKTFEIFGFMTKFSPLTSNLFIPLPQTAKAQ